MFLPFRPECVAPPRRSSSLTLRITGDPAPTRNHTAARLAVVLSIAVTVSAIAPASRASDARTPRRALVVGTGQCTDHPPIEFAGNDLKMIHDTLKSRGGYDVVGMVPDCAEDLRERIRKWVNGSAGAEQLLCYYRGYVTVDAQRRCHLSVAETSTADLDRTAVQLDHVLENLARSPARIALFLDAEYTGDPEALAAAIDDATRRAAQQGPHPPALSVIAASPAAGAPAWDTSESSPFSYWLSRALKGDAAADGTDVTADAVHRCLATRLRGRVHVIHASASPSAGAMVLAPPRPLKLDEVIRDLAEQLSSEFHARGVSVIAVPGFDVETPAPLADSIPGSDHGPLRAYVLNQLKREIALRANFKYRLIDGESLRDVLNRHGISPASIEGPIMQVVSQDLKLSGESVALVVGVIRREASGDQVTIACRPWHLGTGAGFEVAERTALINPSEWAMTGHSAINAPAMHAYLPGTLPKKTATTEPRGTSTPAPPPAPKPFPLLDYSRPDDVLRSVQEVARLEEQSRKEHPMMDRAFPFRIELEGRHRGPWASPDRRHVYYKFDNGERFRIVVHNKSGQPVFLRLLVDGLNTLPDRRLKLDREPNGPGLFEVCLKDPTVAMQPAQFTNLTDATAWYCEPGRFVIGGFYQSIQANGDALRADFVVADGAAARAWKLGYPKDIGIVTAAFYAPTTRPTTMGRDGRQGVQLGQVRKRTVNVYRGNDVPGELLAVIHIRYGIPH